MNPSDEDLLRAARRDPAAFGIALIAVTATTGVIFVPPKPDRSVPAAPERTYFAHDPFAGGGPVLMRHRPERWRV